MLDLNSKRWRELSHAYGDASDVPKLLKHLSELPAADHYKNEPYFTLWSSLCHQGDTYTASYAAAPHLISICGVDTPQKINVTILHLAVCIEISRQSNRGQPVPSDIRNAYFLAIDRVLQVSADLQLKSPSEELAVIAAAAFALKASKFKLAEAFLEMRSDLADDFMSWVFESQ